jgi:hypothetical protein
MKKDNGEVGVGDWFVPITSSIGAQYEVVAVVDNLVTLDYFYNKSHQGFHNYRLDGFFKVFKKLKVCECCGKPE